MCVKEFLGYNCGHCSVPFIKQCPLSASNAVFPICQYPAERPIFINEHCHPCSRVVWNANVLKEEMEHKQRHQNGECFCEIIFNQEERQKRLRRRSTKGHGKAANYISDGDCCANQHPEIAHGFIEHTAQARIAAYRYVGFVAENNLHENTPGGDSNVLAESQSQFQRQPGFEDNSKVGEQVGVKRYPNTSSPSLPVFELCAPNTAKIGQLYLGRSHSAPAEVCGPNEVNQPGRERRDSSQSTHKKPDISINPQDKLRTRHEFSHPETPMLTFGSPAQDRKIVSSQMAQPKST